MQCLRRRPMLFRIYGNLTWTPAGGFTGDKDILFGVCQARVSGTVRAQTPSCKPRFFIHTCSACYLNKLFPVRYLLLPRLHWQGSVVISTVCAGDWVQMLVMSFTKGWTESTSNFWITVLSSFLWVLMALSSQALAADLSGTYSTEDSSARTAVPGSSWKAGRTEAARRSLHSEGGQSCGDDNYRCAAFGEQASAALLPAIVKGPCCQRIAILCCLTDWVRLHVNLQPSSFLIPFANVAIAETSFQFAQAVFYLLLSNILIILMLHFLCLS